MRTWIGIRKWQSCRRKARRTANSRVARRTARCASALSLRLPTRVHRVFTGARSRPLCNSPSISSRRPTGAPFVAANSDGDECGDKTCHSWYHYGLCYVYSGISPLISSLLCRISHVHRITHLFVSLHLPFVFCTSHFFHTTLTR